MSRNPRAVANALDSLAFAAAVSLLPSPLSSPSSPSSPPTSLQNDPYLRHAARLARQAGATAKEIAAAAGLPVDWAKGASLSKHDTRGRAFSVKNGNSRVR